MNGLLASEKRVEGSDEGPQSENALNAPIANENGSFSKALSSWGVEMRGIHPVAEEDRTERHFIKIFFIWLSANMNILSFSTGTLGPVVFGLGLRDSCLVIVFFNLLCSIPPAYLATWGPKLGLRQLCQALASIANISWRIDSVGILIIALTSLIISFFGLRVLNWYEDCAWIPILIIFVIAAGAGGKHFVDPPVAPATAAQVLDFSAIVAGYTLTWGQPARITLRTFTLITLQCFGAAAAISAPSVPEWNAGFKGGNVGGLLAAILSPVGKFGKFLVVLLSLSVTATNAPTIYSMCMSFQTLVPALVAIPRYLFSLLFTTLSDLTIQRIISLAVVAQHKFYVTLSNFLGIIGYWAVSRLMTSTSGAWVAAVVVEHLYFRKGDFALYDIGSWNVPSQLPLGAAALGASVLGIALVIPSMSQVWFTGPIARKAGDIGFEVVIAVTALSYIPLRHLELCWRGV
ncbi:hypothetical protein BC826DRAFT_970819 [Russula brevipes]|nr:hypothetical protein BC826DRAFT_970819 [Russula brevipes]